MREKDFNSEKKTSQEILKRISSRDFLNFGVQHIAYVRPVRVQDKTAFAIHAADGTPLSVMESLDTAIVLMRHNDLEPATVH